MAEVGFGSQPIREGMGLTGSLKDEGHGAERQDPSSPSCDQLSQGTVSFHHLRQARTACGVGSPERTVPHAS